MRPLILAMNPPLHTAETLISATRGELQPTPTVRLTAHETSSTPSTRHFLDTPSAPAYRAPKFCGVEQLAAREAHNLEVGGSSPPPAT